MSKMIQIRNVPDGVHRELKARAARKGQSLSAYILADLERSVATPTLDEILARLQRLPPLEPAVDVLAILDEARGER